MNSTGISATINISVSPCEYAARLGYDERQMNRIIIRIAQFFLFNGMRVLFGHDWRANGVMRAVLNDAERAVGATRIAPVGPRMVNLVATGGKPLSKIALEAAWDARGVLEVRTILDDAQVPVPGDRCWELWTLRQRLTELLDPGCRICLGGRTDGYAGHHAGVAEEAYFALEMGKPLYLIGGLGGATGAVCEAILGEAPVGSNSHRALAPRGGACPATHPAAPLPLGGLAPSFQAFGLDKLSADNGLEPADNRRLFEMTDIEAAIGLISKGMRRSLAEPG